MLKNFLKTSAMKQSELFLPPLILLTTLFFFAFGIAIQKVDNICFFLLSLYAIGFLVFQSRADRKYTFETCKKYWAVILSMFSLVLAIGINQLVSGAGLIRTYDKPAKLALFAFLFLVFLKIPASKFAWAKWGFIAGVTVCSIQIISLTSDGISRPMVNDTELIGLLSIFSILSIGWNRPDQKWMVIFQLLAGVLGIYTVYLSQTRGVWICLPIFAMITFFSLSTIKHRKKHLALLIGFLIVVGVISSSSNIGSHRIREAVQDVDLYMSHEQMDSSIGIRFQLWKGSWILFKENPVVGIGRSDAEFVAGFKTLVDRKIVTPSIPNQPHSHNEFLYNMATLGLVGLASLLFIYFVPIFYFFKEVRHPDMGVRTSAAMGLCLCVGFIIFGLVDVMFKYKGATIFYSISVAYLLAHIQKTKEALSLLPLSETLSET